MTIREIDVHLYQYLQSYIFARTSNTYEDILRSADYALVAYRSIIVDEIRYA